MMSKELWNQRKLSTWEIMKNKFRSTKSIEDWNIFLFSLEKYCKISIIWRSDSRVLRQKPVGKSYYTAMSGSKLI